MPVEESLHFEPFPKIRGNILITLLHLKLSKMELWLAKTNKFLSDERWVKGYKLFPYEFLSLVWKDFSLGGVFLQVEWRACILCFMCFSQVLAIALLHVNIETIMIFFFSLLNYSNKSCVMTIYFIIIIFAKSRYLTYVFLDIIIILENVTCNSNSISFVFNLVCI